ncbi:MAG TPA: adenylate kinase [Dehalococcoidia bacterium]|nr:adenylate kinase [Dehalococcoidia bacterium]
MSNHIILLGAPGSGKGTQADTLRRTLGLAHVASGDLFREAAQKGTEPGKLAKSYMEKGELVPDEVTVAMVLERLKEPDCALGAILDGFPRTLEQAKALEEALQRERGEGINRVLYIEVSEAELLTRLGGRWICRQCQHPYHVVNFPPRVAGRCDRCGGELYQRSDDSMETARRRLEVYFAQTTPLIHYYGEQSLLTRINGEQDVDVVGRDLLAGVSR